MSKAAVVFLTDSRLYCADEQQVRELNSQYIENYKNNITEIRKKNAWKNNGRGAMFMGVNINENETNSAVITAAIPLKHNKLVYACNVGNVGGLYTKNPFDENEIEGYIIRKKSLMIFEMDYCPADGSIIASVSQDRLTRNLAMFNENNTQEDILTEGEVVDRNPCFSKVNPALVYYDSAGYAITETGIAGGLSQRSILSLNLKSGMIDVVAEQPEYDLFKPKSAADGGLYYLCKPQKETEHSRTTFSDVIKMPGKIGRAIFGWLNFFTQRYAGESLKKTGTGPVKTRAKSDEQIFVEGNLINLTRSMRENMAAGDKYPGIVPKNWQLIRMSPGGMKEVLVKGVLDYTLGADGTIYYSNGKHIIQKEPDGKEVLVCERKMAQGIQVF